MPTDLRAKIPGARILAGAGLACLTASALLAGGLIVRHSWELSGRAISFEAGENYATPRSARIMTTSRSCPEEIEVEAHAGKIKLKPKGDAEADPQFSGVYICKYDSATRQYEFDFEKYKKDSQ